MRRFDYEMMGVAACYMADTKEEMLTAIKTALSHTEDSELKENMEKVIDFLEKATEEEYLRFCAEASMEIDEDTEE